MEQQHGAIPTSAGVDKVEPASRVVVSREGQTTSIEGKKRNQELGQRWSGGEAVGISGHR